MVTRKGPEVAETVSYQRRLNIPWLSLEVNRKEGSKLWLCAL